MKRSHVICIGFLLLCFALFCLRMTRLAFHIHPSPDLTELGNLPESIASYQSLEYSVEHSERPPLDGEAETIRDLDAIDCSKLLENLHSLEPPEILANYHQGDVLLLHGRAYSSSNWEAINTIKILAAQGFRTIAIDLPGFGKTPPLSLTVANEEKFIECVLERFELDHPFLVSPSMSGSYAIPYVLKHFDKLAGFIPIAPSAASDVHIEQFERITIPTLVLYGSNDKKGAEISNNILSFIPHSNIYSISNAGHACYLDNPREFHVQLVKFLIKNRLRN